MSFTIARESPWGPLRVVDAHVHFFSHKFFELLCAQKPGLTLADVQAKTNWVMPPADAKMFAAEWARELDKHGVPGAAVMASLPGDQASVLEAAAAYPDRLLPYAMVNPKLWNAEAMSGVRVACLFPAMHGYSIQDDAVRPVFEWAEQAKRAVFIHCGTLSVGVRDKLGLPSLFDLRYSNPIDVQLVARRHPKVPIVIPHFGAGFFREALMLAEQNANIFLDTSSSNKWMRYQEANLDLRHVFRKALEVVGPKRLLFGTDSSFFPRGWHFQIFEEQAKALYEVGVHGEDARGIFGENLLRIFAA
ncbi:MAG: amidohydrolase family protein [Bryobacteraceae bacterium]